MRGHRYLVATMGRSSSVTLGLTEMSASLDLDGESCIRQDGAGSLDDTRTTVRFCCDPRDRQSAVTTGESICGLGHDSRNRDHSGRRGVRPPAEATGAFGGEPVRHRLEVAIP